MTALPSRARYSPKPTPPTITAQRDSGVAYERLGARLMVAVDNPRKPNRLPRQPRHRPQRLAEADPTNATTQRDLIVAYIKLGDLLTQGRQHRGTLTALPRQPGDCHRLAGSTPPTPTGNATCRQPLRRRATWWRPQRRGAQRSTATAWPSGATWPRPTPPTPPGNATCRRSLKLGDLHGTVDHRRKPNVYRDSLAIATGWPADPTNAAGNATWRSATTGWGTSGDEGRHPDRRPDGLP